MNKQASVFIDNGIDVNNIYSFSKFKKLRLAVYMREKLQATLLPQLRNQKNCQVHFCDSTADLEKVIETETIDAIIVDASGCTNCQFWCLKRLSLRAGYSPVIAVGDDFDPEFVQQIFQAGIEDLVPLDEVTPTHLLRVVGYAVVRRRNLEKVRAFAERHSGIIENATEGIFQTTPKGHYILANPALASLYGFETPEELISELTNIETQLYVDPKRRKEFYRLMKENDQVINFESQIRRKDGGIIWINENARAVRGDDNKILYFEGFVRNITARKNNEAQLSYLAHRDPLTGLPNRSLYQDRLAGAIDEAEKENRKVGLLFIDLDNFKNINDTMGHPVGDQILQKVADRLLSCTNSRDTVARLSGDEFTVIVKDISSPDIVARVASRILDSLAMPFSVDNRTIYTSGSIGASIFPDNGRTISELMQNVDTAAYHAKKLGRNNFQFYTENLSEQAIRRLEIENGLRNALKNNEFTLAYQPKVDLNTEKIIGAEALLRWKNKQLGQVSPEEFIPVAEESGLIVPIGDWVLKEACAQARKWLDQGLNPGSIAVNLSPRQFIKKGLLESIQSVLQDSNLPASHLELELTETTLVEHVSEAIETMNKLADIGVQCSIDDFGTGYSSLSYLKKFPIKTLKIDRSFVMDIPDDPEDIAITRAIISLAHSLELKIVAEGIEDKSQQVFLNSLNCHYGQGYYFSKPLSSKDFTRTLLISDL